MTTLRIQPDPTASGSVLLLHEALARSHQPEA
jgi:hypothetical protein